jgi:integrase
VRKRYPTTKPYATFPLTPRSDGRFVKTIRGVPHTFGGKGDWRAALDEYAALAPMLHAGRVPTSTAELVTVRQMANVYLAERDADVKHGTLTLGSWDDYRDALGRFVRFVGPSTPARELGPDHFTRFGQKLRGSLGSYAYNRTRALILAWLRHAGAAEWVKPPINVGVGFKRIPAGKIRGERKSRLFTPAQIAKLLKLAKPQMRAMILLGLNGGFGSTDCARLTRDVIDLKGKVIRYRRTKTNIPRTVPLWPETVKALRPLLELRPDDPLVFRTRHGKVWVRTERGRKGKVVTKDAVADRFGKMMDEAKIDMPGVGFYALRHTFATHANEVRDADARRHVMGRRLPDLDDVYIEHLFLPRLKILTDHVRSRVLRRTA